MLYKVVLNSRAVALNELRSVNMNVQQTYLSWPQNKQTNKQTNKV